MIGRFFGFLWSIARFFPTVAPGIRFGSGSSVLLTFLFLVFFVIGAILVALGFDLNEVSLWLDRNADWFDWIGTMLFKGLLVFILLICCLVVYGVFEGWLRPRKAAMSERHKRKGGSEPDPPGGCFLLVALAIGYVCVVGIFFT
jgi:hypothetical protein